MWSYGLADFMESMQVRKGKLEAEWLTSRSITLKESVALTPSIRHIERPLDFEPEKYSDSAWLEHDAMRRWTDIACDMSTKFIVSPVRFLLAPSEEHIDDGSFRTYLGRYLSVRLYVRVIFD